MPKLPEEKASSALAARLVCIGCLLSFSMTFAAPTEGGGGDNGGDVHPLQSHTVRRRATQENSSLCMTPGTVLCI